LFSFSPWQRVQWRTAGAYWHALAMIAAGLAFGLWRVFSRSIAFPAPAHMLVNGLVLLLQ